MRRILAPALIASLFAFSTVGLVGCGETEGTKTTTEQKGPDGKTTSTTETKTKVEGDGGAAPATPKAP